MRKITKSYLKTFFKSWVETFGSILFTILLTLTAIGLMGPSVQIINKINNIERKTNKWDFEMDNNYNYYSADLVFNYFYSHNDFDLNDEIKLEIPEGEFSFFTPEFYQSLHAQLGAPESDQPLKMEEIEDGRVFTGILNTTMSVLMSSQNGLHTQSKIEEIGGSRNLTYGELFTVDFQDLIGKNSGNYGSVQLFLQNQIFKNALEEKKILVDYKPKMYFEERPVLQSKGRSIEIRKISDNSKNELDNLIISEGELPKYNTNTPEVVVTDLFAKSNNLKIGDMLELPLGYNNGLMINQKFKISGFGTSLESLATGENYFSTWKNSHNYFYAFLDSKTFDDKFFDFYNNQNQDIHALRARTLIKLNDKNFNIEKMFVNENTGVTIFNKSDDILINFKDDFSIENLNITRIEAMLFIMIAVVVLFLAFVFINFLIRKEINDSLKQLGIFKASGYTNFELAWVFAIKVTISIFIGILIGYFISFPVQSYVLSLFSEQIIFFVHPVLYSLGFLALIFILIPVSFLLISYFLITILLGKSTMFLINNTARIKEPNQFQIILTYVFFPIYIWKITSNKMNHLLIQKNIGFNYRLRSAFTKRSKGKFIVTISLFSLSTMLFLFQLGSKDLIDQNYHRFTRPYNENLDHFYKFNSQPNIIWDQENGFKIEKENDFVNNPINYVGYNKGDFQKTVQENSDNFQEKVSFLVDSIIGAIKNDSENLISDKMITNGFSSENWENLGIGLTKLLKTNIFEMSENNSFENLPQISNNSELDKTALLYPHEQIQGKTSAFKLDDLKRIIMLIYFQNSAIEYSNTSYNNLIDQGMPSQIALSITRKGLENIIGKEDFSDFKINEKLFNENNNGLTRSVDFQSGNLPQITRILFASALGSQLENQTLITSNKLFYNRDTDNLSYSLNVKPLIKSNSDYTNMELIDFDNKYGDFKNAWRIRLTKSDTLQNMKNQGFDNPFETKVIISKLFAKKYNLKIGDSFLVSTKTNPGLSAITRMRVADINLANTYTETMFADYETFFQVNSSSILNPEKEDSVVLKNRLSSQTEIYLGDLNTNDFASTYLNIKLNTDSLAINYEIGTPILGFWLKEILPLKELFNDEVSFAKSPTFITNPSLTDKFNNSSMSYVKLSKIYADDLVSEISSMMTLFMILNSALLVILFIIIMNIVIDTSKNIIFTMKAFGYKNSEINWIVIGNYVIFSFIAFILSYLFSLIVWSIVLDIAWTTSNVLMEFPWSFAAPMITFSALSVVAFFGWLTAQMKIRRESIISNLD
ncbi:ABC transporter permease [Spiroplasma alleghenense]|uniref:ABC transporter permease n=1 Tax=Spiroplasma alleghenense TaxID=216931 RepID=A0A345Z3X4_9MOLU|nr:ABC transporter permease [Spiroplasma alleghenense]AXK51303.1 ABC transporter permease [Spiroplasma alleghenense]